MTQSCCQTVRIYKVRKLITSSFAEAVIVIVAAASAVADVVHLFGKLVSLCFRTKQFLVFCDLHMMHM